MVVAAPADVAAPTSPPGEPRLPGRPRPARPEPRSVHGQACGLDDGARWRSPRATPSWSPRHLGPTRHLASAPHRRSDGGAPGRAAPHAGPRRRRSRTCGTVCRQRSSLLRLLGQSAPGRASSEEAVGHAYQPAVRRASPPGGHAHHRHRRRRLHRLDLRATAPRQQRRPRHRRRQADVRGQPGQPRRAGRGPCHDGPLPLRARPTSPTNRSCGSWPPSTTPSSTSPPSRMSTAPSSSRPPSCTPASWASTRSWRRRVPSTKGGRSARRRSERFRFVQVSTDEVYGPVPEGLSARERPLRPTSPYSAAKAAGEHLVAAYHETYGLDTVITRGANTYGPNQYPEKLIPLFVTNALDDEPLPMYGDGMQRRDWLFVDDHADGIAIALERGASGGAYNMPGGRRRAAQPGRHRGHPRAPRQALVARAQRARSARPRSALCTRRLAAARARLASRASPFDEGIARTIDWYARAPRLVGAHQERRLGRLLPRPVRLAPGAVGRGLSQAGVGRGFRWGPAASAHALTMHALGSMGS